MRQRRLPSTKMIINKFFPYLMIAPTILILGILIFYPLVVGIRLSFFDYNLMFPIRPFVGLKNYFLLLGDRRFIFLLWNTILFALLSVAFSTLLGLLIALFLNRRSRVTGVYRAICFIPWITPSVVVSFVFAWIFNKSFSPVNSFLVRVSLIDEPVAFLGDFAVKFLGLSLPFWSVLAVRTWTQFPFKMVMFLAALQTIPQDLYDAAKIDGANKIQQFRFVTFPYILPVATLVISLSLIWNLALFDINFLMTSGGPYDLTNVVPIFIYNEAFVHYRMGLASAAGAIILIFASIIGLIYLRLMRREVSL